MKHTKRWTSREGIVYSFENDKIISFQDNFRQMRDVPFTFYFDFETTTGNDIFKDPKMFVISYCQICSFHCALNLDKIVIFRSFQQSVEEMYDSRHFRQEHVPFFDKVTFDQLKDAASAVIALEKTTSFAELFSLELKFTKDTLQGWFRQTIEWLELDDIKKEILIKENPIALSKTTCCICGLSLDVEGGKGNNEKTWYDFVVEKEHIFIRNVDSREELAKMENVADIGDYRRKFECFLKIVTLLEKYLNNFRIEENFLLDEFFYYDLEGGN